MHCYQLMIQSEIYLFFRDEISSEQVAILPAGSNDIHRHQSSDRRPDSGLSVFDRKKHLAIVSAGNHRKTERYRFDFQIRYSSYKALYQS